MDGSFGGLGGLISGNPFLKNFMPFDPMKCGNDAVGDASGAMVPVEAPTVSEQAVTATNDTVAVDPLSQSVAQLQAIIEKLNSAMTGADAVGALEELQNFIGTNTNSSLAGGVLEEVGSLVDTVLDALGDDPEALGGIVSFSFNAEFSQKTLVGDDFYKQKTSFSFDFHLETEDTVVDASLDFKEKLVQTDNVSVLKRKESAHVRVVTFNTDIEENPALVAFNKIADKLAGVDPLASLSAQEVPSTLNLLPPLPRNPEAKELLERFSKVQANLEAVRSSLEILGELHEKVSARMREIYRIPLLALPPAEEAAANDAKSPVTPAAADEEEVAPVVEAEAA